MESLDKQTSTKNPSHPTTTTSSDPMMDPSTTASSAIHTVLKQEVFRFTRLLNVIHASLNSLYQAIHGLVLLSVDIEETYKSLLINQVPRQWQVGTFSDFALEGC